MDYDVEYEPDDPSTWAIPQGLARLWHTRIHEESDTVILDWWRQLHVQDERIHEEFGPERFQILKNLVEEYDRVRNEYTDSAQDQQVLKHVYYSMIEHGLDTRQIGTLTGRGRADVVRSLLSNRTLSNADVEQRWKMEDMLRAGSTVQEIVNATGSPKHVVTQWAKSLRIKPPISGPSHEYGRMAREEAYRMYDAGVSVSEIVETLNSKYTDRKFSKVAVYKWMSRRRLGE